MATRSPRKKSPGKKRAYHHGDLRRALLTAARGILHEVGHRELSLREVARRTGVSHAAAYHHFKDKNALLFAIASEGFQLLNTRMLEEADKVGADPIERLVAIGVGYVRMAREDRAAYDLMFNAGLHPELEAAGAAHVETGETAFMTLKSHVVAARKAAGITDDSTLMQWVLYHWEIVHGMALLADVHCGRDPGFDPIAHARFVCGMSRALYAPASARDKGA
jgi:AcrR family transcriptional regulator